ncbi:universal stress protein [Sulfitobacter sp. D35]|uniref:universal stress protein n=1 Tax=Sulfitobacter sp. D35 TaxID=3083252 RepID=UPI00296E6632|nr:universal stress protein [Sulfitobacter sp. D35]MDW4497079.1 universal stress protein [Sulfitobacter sp. D35]
MTTKIVVGLDGESSGERAVAFARTLAERMDACEVILVYVIEWSPFTFQTAEENAQRHKRREEEIEAATSRVVEPAVAALTKNGMNARGVVRHGDVAEILERIASEEGATQIVVARKSETGFAQRLFGSSTVNLVTHASVPVTVVA